VGLDKNAKLYQHSKVNHFSKFFRGPAKGQVNYSSRSIIRVEPAGISNIRVYLDYRPVPDPVFYAQLSFFRSKVIRSVPLSPT
jgi:hypothetical protein